MDSLKDMRLVEQAAQAAGFGLARWSDDGRGLLLTGVQEPWNPLDDDGDALRLAVKLRMVIDCEDDPDEDDRTAAIRRAIVLAAVSKTPNVVLSGSRRQSA